MSLRRCVESDWICNSGQLTETAVLEGVGGALSTLSNKQLWQAPPPNARNMLLTFAVAVREGQYGLGHQVKVHSVSKALHAVAQKYVLGGHHDPRQSSPAQQSVDLPIAHLLKRFGNNDPPAESKLAVPMLGGLVKGFQPKKSPNQKSYWPQKRALRRWPAKNPPVNHRRPPFLAMPG